MRISGKLRKDAGHIWKKIFEHPFVVELYSGTLPMERFRFYVLQDYNYLVNAIKNFSIICSRADTADVVKEIADVIHLEATSEFNGYEELLNKLGYKIEDAMNVDAFPINVSYRSFLLATSSLRPYQESITSVLPCFWSYSEIAKHHRDKLSENKNEIYVEWASVFLSGDYLNLVNKLRNFVDTFCEDYPYGKLRDIFITVSRFEYMYWDAVYKMESWPV
ncbi:MAG: thiaminase II [Syntrophobacterales bacterium]|nr:thiaminase II [Syntrophobacterales bacterium]